MSISTRQSLIDRSAEAWGAFDPAGSGLGSYREVYRLFESPSEVNSTFVNHAHNDYLELAVELGLPGVLLMILFLAWWGATAWQVGRSQAFDQYAQAGVVASGRSSFTARSIIRCGRRRSAQFSRPASR